MLTKKKKYVVILLAFLISMYSPISGFCATPVIQLGNWGLENSFEIRYGYDNFKAYTYNEIQNLYNENNLDAKSNEIYLESNYIQYQQYDIQLQNICQNIQKYKQLIQEDGDMAKLYEQELAAAIVQKAEIYVKKENCFFIHNNATAYRHQQLIAQLSQLRNSIFEIKFLKENNQAVEIFAEYAKLQADTQTINKSKDLAFQTDIDFYTADFDYYINQKDLILQQFNNSFEQLLSNSNITTSLGIIINIDTQRLRNLGPKSFATVENDSNLNDIKKKQLENRINILDEKINILKEYYTEDSSQVQLTQKERELAALELKKWMIERKRLLLGTYAEYKNRYYEIAINEKKVKVQHEKYIILLNKYNFGLNDRISVKEAEINYVKSSLAAWKTLYEYANALGRIDMFMSGKIE